jgi:hypothetical protein
MRFFWVPSAFCLPTRSAPCSHVTLAMADGQQSTMNLTSIHGFGGFFNGQSFSFIRYGIITGVIKTSPKTLPNWLRPGVMNNNKDFPTELAKSTFLLHTPTKLLRYIYRYFIV